MSSESRKADLSAAARALRAVNSPAQQEAARKNGAKGGRPVGSVKPLAEIKCACGGGDGLDHKSSCPRGRAIRRRRQLGQPLE